MSSRAELRVLELGRFARRVLRNPARVIARFERSYYVGNAAGIACVGAANLGSGPLNAIAAGALDIPAIGTTLIARLPDARTWRPRRMEARGLAPSPMPEIERGMFSRPHAAAGALRDWIAGGARKRARRKAGQLIGLGPGLTPAGDDLVGGALVALHGLRKHACAARVGRWAMRLARRTNRISRAHLACAVAGEGSAALHALINALLEGKRDLSRELAALDAIGHTSGWDAAAGVALVLEALVRPPRTPRARSPARASRRASPAGVRPA